MTRYIHQHKNWPSFIWKNDDLLLPLVTLRHQQGRLMGKLEGLGFQVREEAALITLTQEILKSSEIEGERLPMDQVRSSIARKLGIAIAGEVTVSRAVEGVVAMMLDATLKFNKELTDQRLFDWHSSLFPSGKSGMYNILVGTWRDDSTGPMQVVSGALGKEKVHFEAPDSSRLKKEMKSFLKWFNQENKIDPVLKAGIAHFWFVTIHPFDDGNGRIARAIADMQLTRADGSKQRFYSMSEQIRKDRKLYYAILEKSQKGNLDITEWLLWFINCLQRSIALSEKNLSSVLNKAKFWEDHKTASLNVRQKKMLNKILDGFEGNVTSSKWSKITKSSTDTALRDIQDLIDKKILVKENAGGRSTSYRLK